MSQQDFINQLNRLSESLQQLDLQDPSTNVNLLQTLQNQLSTMKAQAATQVASPVKSKLPKPLPSSRFSGSTRSHTKTEGFLAQAEDIFSFYEMTDDDKIRYAMANFEVDSPASQWILPYRSRLAIPIEERTIPWLTSWDKFKQQVQLRFGDSQAVSTYTEQLLSLRQTGAAADYAIRFRVLTERGDWTESSLREIFKLGLKADVRTALAGLGPQVPQELDVLIETAVSIDEALFSTRRSKNTTVLWQPRPASQVVKPNVTRPLPQSQVSPRSQPQYIPMDVDLARLNRGPITAEQRQHRFRNNLCLYCEKPGHHARDCYRASNRTQGTQANAQQVAVTQVEPSSPFAQAQEEEETH